MDLEALKITLTLYRILIPPTAYIKNANDTVIQRLYLFENLEFLHDKHFRYENIPLFLDCFLFSIIDSKSNLVLDNMK